MSENTSSKFDNLPPWARGGIAALIVLATVGTGAGIFFGIRKLVLKQQASGAPKKTLTDVNTELAAIAHDPLNPAFYPASTYQGWANSLELLLGGCTNSIHANDEAAWKILAQIHTDRDWLELVKAFGVRSISNCLWFGSTSFDLPSLLKESLLTGTVDGINGVFAAAKMKSRI